MSFSSPRVSLCGRGRRRSVPILFFSVCVLATLSLMSHVFTTSSCGNEFYLFPSVAAASSDGVDAIAAAQEFMERNGKERDILSTDSGLQYRVIRGSSGDRNRMTTSSSSKNVGEAHGGGGKYEAEDEFDVDIDYSISPQERDEEDEEEGVEGEGRLVPSRSTPCLVNYEVRQCERLFLSFSSYH